MPEPVVSETIRQIADLKDLHRRHPCVADLEDQKEGLILNVMDDPHNNRRSLPTGLVKGLLSKDSTSTSGGFTTLIVLIVAWYASSVVCTNTSKSLNLNWRVLTFCQMIISTLCAAGGISLFRLEGTGRIQWFPRQSEATILTLLLSLAFCAGFVTLNASISFMHVSAVMTMRAAEPVATWILGVVLLPAESTTCSQVLALIPIVIGAGLSAVAKESSVNTIGFALVMMCNVCFALRTLLTKQLKAKYDIDNYNLFLQLCLFGSVWQGIIWLVSGEAFRDLASVDYSILIANGVTFYLYLQLSWVVMGRMGAVTHSVCNALRRPVICASGWVIFGGATFEGIAGVAIATLGTMLYARAKRRST